MQVATEIAQQRATFVGEGCRHPGGRVQCLGEGEELLRIQAAAARCTLDRGTDVVRAADADGRTVGQERSGLVGLVQPPRDEDGIG